MAPRGTTFKGYGETPLGTGETPKALELWQLSAQLLSLSSDRQKYHSARMRLPFFLEKQSRNRASCGPQVFPRVFARQLPVSVVTPKSRMALGLLSGAPNGARVVFPRLSAGAFRRRDARVAASPRRVYLTARQGVVLHLRSPRAPCVRGSFCGLVASKRMCETVWEHSDSLRESNSTLPTSRSHEM